MQLTHVLRLCGRDIKGEKNCQLDVSRRKNLTMKNCEATASIVFPTHRGGSQILFNCNLSLTFKRFIIIMHLALNVEYLF